MARSDVGTLPETVDFDPTQPGGRPDTTETSVLDAESRSDVQAGLDEDLSGEAIARDSRRQAEVMGPGAVTASSTTEEITESILNGDLSTSQASSIYEQLDEGQQVELKAELRAAGQDPVELTRPEQGLKEVGPNLEQYQSQNPDAGEADPLVANATAAYRDVQEQYPEEAETVERSQRQERLDTLMDEVDPEREAPDRGQTADGAGSDGEQRRANPAEPSQSSNPSVEDSMERNIAYQGAMVQQV